MALVNQVFDGAAWVDSSVRQSALTGTPLVSVAANGSGEALADNYVLTFSAVVPGVSANVAVATTSPNNPHKTASKAVVLDGATVHKNIVPGYDIIFSNAGGFTNAWTVTLLVGQYLGTVDASGGGAGVPTAAARQRAYNAGTGAVSNALAGLRNIVKPFKKVGSVFISVKGFAPGSTEKTAGGGSSRVMPYVLTISGVAGAGAGKTCNLSVDGVLFGAGTLQDLVNPAAVSGTGLKAVAGQGYRVLSGNLTGLEFYIDPACANGDTINILIFLPRYRRIAPETAPNTPGVYGSADIVLTETGQAAGVITAGGFAYYWGDILVPAGASPESNPYPTDIYVAGTETGAAGYNA